MAAFKVVGANGPVGELNYPSRTSSTLSATRVVPDKRKRGLATRINDGSKCHDPAVFVSCQQRRVSLFFSTGCLNWKLLGLGFRRWPMGRTPQQWSRLSLVVWNVFNSATGGHIHVLAGKVKDSSALVASAPKKSFGVQCPERPGVLCMVIEAERGARGGVQPKIPAPFLGQQTGTLTGMRLVLHAVYSLNGIVVRCMSILGLILVLKMYLLPIALAVW